MQILLWITSTVKYLSNIQQCTSYRTTELVPKLEFITWMTLNDIIEWIIITNDIAILQYWVLHQIPLNTFWESDCLMLIWPILFCPAIQSGWSMCCSPQTGGWTLWQHSGHPPRPQLPPTHSQLSSRTGIWTRSSWTSGFKSQLL